MTYLPCQSLNPPSSSEEDLLLFQLLLSSLSEFDVFLFSSFANIGNSSANSLKQHPIVILFKFDDIFSIETKKTWPHSQIFFGGLNIRVTPIFNSDPRYMKRWMGEGEGEFFKGVVLLLFGFQFLRIHIYLIAKFAEFHLNNIPLLLCFLLWWFFFETIFFFGLTLSGMGSESKKNDYL